MLAQSPYDFQLTLRVMNNYSKNVAASVDALWIGARIAGRPVVITIRPADNRGELEITSSPAQPAAEVEGISRWVVFADLALQPFYELARGHPVFGRVIRDLAGLKPMRPASLLEMAVIVITEQQISLAAANHIRARLVARYGDQVEGVWVFPDVQKLAVLSPEDLRLWLFAAQS